MNQESIPTVSIEQVSSHQGLCEPRMKTGSAMALIAYNSLQKSIQFYFQK